MKLLFTDLLLLIYALICRIILLNFDHVICIADCNVESHFPAVNLRELLCGIFLAVSFGVLKLVINFCLSAIFYTVPLVDLIEANVNLEVNCGLKFGYELACIKLVT